MKELQNSLETEKLAELIREKKRYYNKLYRQDSENQYLRLLNSEITFLENTVMPLLLMKTTILYSGLSHYMTMAMREMEVRKDRDRFCGVLMYFQTHQLNDKELPLVAVASNRKMTPDHMINMTVDGKQAVTLPVFPKLADEQMDEWYKEQHRLLLSCMRSIDKRNLEISHQQFVNP